MIPDKYDPDQANNEIFVLPQNNPKIGPMHCKPYKKFCMSRYWFYFRVAEFFLSVYL